MTGSTTDATSSGPTGERFEPPLMGGRAIEAEHLVRYAWAAQFAAGKRVLDAACGMAYGAAMLAAAGASEVIGIDLDADVIAEVGTDGGPEISFQVADLHNLPFEADEFDLVVCFEAIEHVPEPGLVLDELSRVVRPDGLLLVSTPNRDVYTPGNPFHLRELTPNELGAELGKRFRSVALRRQHTWVASGIFEDEAFSVSGHELIDGIEVRKATANEPGEETYTIGIAGDGELPVGLRMISLTSDIEVRDWSKLLDAADLALAAAPVADGSQLDAELELIGRELAELRRQLIEAESDLARFAEVEAQLADTAGALASYEDLQNRLDGLQAQHESILRSSSWRYTRPLRGLAGLLRSRS